LFSLSNKVALVTGATGGIGQAIARSLHQLGATVILSGTKEHALRDLSASFTERCYVVAADLSAPDQVLTLIERAENEAGPVDILVCNAGITRDNLALRMKEEDFDAVLNLNLRSAFSLNKEAIKRMLRRKWGRIINISSVVAVSGNPGQANYCAAKAGLIGMSKALAQEVASRQITINCVAPGFIDTPMTASLPDQQKQHLIESIPAKLLGSPNDIASAVAFLASEEARYITGHTLHVNGGMLMV
jgi:3-oxoacyl-[acyl-carrier protein] reductase